MRTQNNNKKNFLLFIYPFIGLALAIVMLCTLIARGFFGLSLTVNNYNELYLDIIVVLFCIIVSLVNIQDVLHKRKVGVL